MNYKGIELQRPKEKSSLEVTQDKLDFLKDCRINPFGFGILKNMKIMSCELMENVSL